MTDLSVPLQLLICSTDDSIEIGIADGFGQCLSIILAIRALGKKTENSVMSWIFQSHKQTDADPLHFPDPLYSTPKAMDNYFWNETCFTHINNFLGAPKLKVGLLAKNH